MLGRFAEHRYDIRGPGFKDSRIQGFRDSGIRRFAIHDE